MSSTETQGEEVCSSALQEDATSSVSQDKQEPPTSEPEAQGVEAETNEVLEPTATSSKKTPKCRFFKKSGKCRFGEGCKFAHELQEGSPRDVSRGAISSGGSEDVGQPETTPQGKPDATSLGKPVSSAAEAEKKACRFYLKGSCRSGQRCKFLHEKKKAINKTDVSSKKDETTGGTPREEPSDLKSGDAKTKKEKPQKICRFFKAGHCNAGERCKFRHPEDYHDQAAQAKAAKLEKVRATERKPNVPQTALMTMKIADASVEDLQKLRETEITQLMKRFTEECLTVMENEGESVYRVTVNPTDPDWPFDVRDFELEVTFPASYPVDPFTVTMPEDQVLPNTVLEHMGESISEWVLARHGTNQISGKVELMFRPFLRWLDRGLERMFTDAAKKFKKVVDAKVAGFEFVAYSKQPPQQSENTNAPRYDDSVLGPEGVTIALERSTLSDQGAVDDDQSTDAVLGVTPSEEKTTKHDDISNVQRKGTEIKLSGLQLSESLSTLVAQKIGVTIQCTRCKSSCDVITPPRRLNSARCGKCHHQQLVTFRPSLIHHFSSTLGFLDLEGCTTFDLLSTECIFAIGCLNCSEEAKIEGLQFGQIKAHWCEKCHAKMTVQMETAKFQRLQASDCLPADKAHVIPVKSIRKQVHPDIHEGHPLPQNGTCKHYKKSFRWLRFPCCGKCYPCDECHGALETDHEMKYATRMICGFCCKEQQFSPDKPCISCNSLTTRGRTTHWEGGLGCRNKTKMSKTDKQKYSNISKTVSRKQQNIQNDKKAVK
ncbi:uncharacterized protein LOC117295389 [Asterias rubens]|uniref:uncharacterized protein LOC117295389 n=1 Tax=Asterias rubens TaxID=7604 RepID=UPI0014554824|nr:uncharacterized protein LOC117295389 [Asterias rubens]XP_033633903.1 uncharacterized protein LOC117295389 [Asterias rubens]